MRAILIAFSLLLTAVAVAPTASADDWVCHTAYPGGIPTTVCHSYSFEMDDHDCVIFGVGQQQTATGVCTVYGNEAVCMVGGGQIRCFVEY